MNRGREMREQAFLVRINQLGRLRMSIPKLRAAYFVHSAGVLWEIASV